MLLAGRDSWIEVRGGRIAELGPGAPPGRAGEVVDGVLGRGLVDLQVNGAAGHEVTGGPAALDAIDALQLAHGVTSYLPTIVSTDEETAARAVAEIAERAADPRSPVEGAHLEGPFLRPEHRGAHRPEHLRVPAGGLPAAYASPAVRLVTLAPELPGALELVRALRERGIAVALGHSGCDAATARRALDAGARMVTHLFNAMAPLRHREPGLAGVALTDPRVRIGLIADGVHVDPAVLTLVRRAAGGRVVLVSDASAARLAGAPLRRDGDAVTDSAGVLAGSALTLDEAARRWVALAGATRAAAHAAASARPARAVGMPRALRRGGPADVVVLDDEGRVRRVMRRGRWVA